MLICLLQVTSAAGPLIFARQPIHCSNAEIDVKTWFCKADCAGQSLPALIDKLDNINKIACCHHRPRSSLSGLLEDCSLASQQALRIEPGRHSDECLQNAPAPGQCHAQSCTSRPDRLSLPPGLNNSCGRQGTEVLCGHQQPFLQEYWSASTFLDLCWCHD